MIGAVLVTLSVMGITVSDKLYDAILECMGKPSRCLYEEIDCDSQELEDQNSNQPAFNKSLRRRLESQCIHNSKWSAFWILRHFYVRGTGVWSLMSHDYLFLPQLLMNYFSILLQTDETTNQNPLTPHPKYSKTLRSISIKNLNCIGYLWWLCQIPCTEI